MHMDRMKDHGMCYVITEYKTDSTFKPNAA